MAEEKQSNYGAEQIQVLEGLEAVRKRPGMYIGTTSSDGLHHLVYEIVDNSIDEALAGYGKEINVTIHKDNSITVLDYGRGIPVEIHPKMGMPTVEVVLTVLHAGGKFGGGGYKVSGGLHGVGMSVVNALSTLLEVEIRREGKVYRQTFCQGRTTSPLEVIGTASDTGTKIHFVPDPAIFTDTTVYDFKVLRKRLKELAFLNKGLTISLKDEREGMEQEEVYLQNGGIIDFVQSLNEGKDGVTDVIYFEGERDGVQVEIALQYTDSYSENIKSFANNINTHEGGMHETGFKIALNRVINNYARKNNILKENEENLTGDDIREGMTAIISVKVPEPQFEGQTKTKLGNSEVRGICDTITGTSIAQYLEEHPAAAKKMIEKSRNAARAREAARKARESPEKDRGYYLHRIFHGHQRFGFGYHWHPVQPSGYEISGCGCIGDLWCHHPDYGSGPVYRIRNGTGGPAYHFAELWCGAVWKNPRMHRIQFIQCRCNGPFLGGGHAGIPQYPDEALYGCNTVCGGDRSPNFAGLWPVLSASSF